MNTELIQWLSRNGIIWQYMVMQLKVVGTQAAVLSMAR